VGIPKEIEVGQVSCRITFGDQNDSHFVSQKKIAAG